MRNTKQVGFKTYRALTVIRVVVVLLSVWWTTADLALADARAPSHVLSDYYLVGIARIEGISYASLIDRQTNNHYLLSTNHPEPGLVLASVLTEDEPSGPAAVIQKDGVSVFLKLNSLNSVSQTLAFEPPPPTVQSFGSAQAIHLRPPPGATLPLIFQAVDSKKLNLTDDQKAIIGQLRQNFIVAVGGTGQSASGVPTTPTPSLAETSNNPSNASQSTANDNASAIGDPALSNWQSAQEQSDAIFKMQFGTQAFNLYQMALSHQGAQKV